MQNDENWESEIDWSMRTSLVGGPVFYEFIKTQALPTLSLATSPLSVHVPKPSCGTFISLFNVTYCIFVSPLC